VPDDPKAAAARPRRADAERSIARILDAAVEGLAQNPDASMADISRRAGVVRATIYVHFPTRESLIAAVTHRAVTEVSAVIGSAAPEAGDPVEALERVVSAAWQTLGRYHGLVSINSRLSSEELHGRHHSALAALTPLIERGQKTGAFRSGVPVHWHLATLLALVHSASTELSAGRITAEQVEDALLTSVVGALTAPAPAQTGDHQRVPATT
jgi:AcrR family transcriptional regulator